MNIRRLIEDTISIQRYQADSKNIRFVTEFIGFPAKERKSVLSLASALEDD